jgi:hypothetical protein
VNLGGRPFRIRKALLDDLAGQSMGEAIHRLGRALLIFHSPVDRVVGIDNATSIYQAEHLPGRAAPEELRLARPGRSPGQRRGRRGVHRHRHRGLGQQVRRCPGPDLARRDAGRGAGDRAHRCPGIRDRDRCRRPSAGRRRAGGAGWLRPGPEPLPAAQRRARRLHGDDPAHVRRAQAAAAGGGAGASGARQGARQGLRRLSPGHLAGGCWRSPTAARCTGPCTRRWSCAAAWSTVASRTRRQPAQTRSRPPRLAQ